MDNKFDKFRKNQLVNSFKINKIEKAYTEGIYCDSPANRKLGRVGMTYSEYAEKVKKEKGNKEEVVEEIKNNTEDFWTKKKDFEAKAAKIVKDKVGFDVEFTYRTSKDFTISYEGNKKENLVKIQNLFNLFKTTSEYDEELDETFVYVNTNGYTSESTKKQNIYQEYLDKIEDNKEDYPSEILSYNPSFLDKIKKSYKDLQTLSLEEKKKLTPFSNPSLYTAAGRTSKEKKAFLNLLKDKGKIILQGSIDDINSGENIIAQINDNIISVNGLEIKTNLKMKKNPSQYLGLPGHKRWYGGGESLIETPLTKKFSVYDREKIDSLIKDLKL